MPSLTIKKEKLEAKLILFDVDGTLVDDKTRYKALAKARMTAIENHLDKEAAETWAKLEGVDPETFNVDMKGPLSKAPRREDLTVAAVALYLHGKPWHTAKELARTMYSEADKIQAESYTPHFFDGVKEKLEEFKQRGFKLGIATNGQSGLTMDVLKTLKADHLFDVIVGADMVLESKPAPDMILKACEHIGVSPRDTIYVGDQPTDIQAARKARLLVIIGVGTEELDATHSIDSVADIS
ncbi:MAG: HAD family hydrolase [Candidatus Bathyarchaeota archaeon]|nr:HAD family hydrolase [Candidatus Bathyarchaeota archaeon]